MALDKLDAKAIFEARQAGDSYAAIAARTNRSPARIRQIYLAESRRLAREKAGRPGHRWRELAIAEAHDLPVRCRTALVQLGFVTLGEVARAIETGQLGERTLLIIPNFGRTSWDALVRWFAARAVHVP